MTLIVPGKDDFNRVEPIHFSPGYGVTSSTRTWDIAAHSGGGGRYFRIASGSASTRDEVEGQVIREMRRVRKIIDDYEATPEFLAAMTVINFNPFTAARRTR